MLHRTASTLLALERSVEGVGGTFKAFAVYEERCETLARHASLKDAQPIGPERISSVLALAKYQNIDAEVLRQRWRADELCFALERQGAISAIVWCNLARCHNALHPAVLGSEEAYSYDLYTDPMHRGRGLAARLKCAMAAHLIERGISRLLSVVALSNRASLRAKRKTSARVVFLGVRLGAAAPVGEHTMTLWRAQEKS